MEKFTEGEWEVVHGEVAFCVKCNGDFITRGGCGCCNQEEDSIRNEADAHLIAQSKAMYFFIKKLVDSAEWYISAIELGSFADGEKLKSEAMEILSKARGEANL